jgi:heme exporter protein D
MDLGPHAAFIWASYVIYGGVLAALILWLVWDGSRLKAKLAELEARGVPRRAQRSAAPQKDA